jgi:morphogenetic protein associated with SpoVID
MPSAYSNSTEPTKSGEGYLGTALSVHKVAAGENLTNIAKTYGVTVDQILKSNPQIKNKNMIKVGEIINIER